MSETVARKRPAAKPSGPVYRALRPLSVGDHVYQPGDIVPEAGTWQRVEAWVRARKLELVER